MLQYASFGSALCAVDVNSDGWADLLVGAPTYISQDTRSYDEGRVFVFISDGEVQNGKVCSTSISSSILFPVLSSSLFILLLV